mmetsp:Transcript_101794/g.287129  ORF Transcript_101794/g.287129 Transcript_101794/m.287129 type:complete len:418 (-) Transcript_101794:1813-3066(-)
MAGARARSYCLHAIEAPDRKGVEGRSRRGADGSSYSRQSDPAGETKRSSTSAATERRAVALSSACDANKAFNSRSRSRRGGSHGGVPSLSPRLAHRRCSAPPTPGPAPAPGHAAGGTRLLNSSKRTVTSCNAILCLASASSTRASMRTMAPRSSSRPVWLPPPRSRAPAVSTTGTLARALSALSASRRNSRASFAASVALSVAALEATEAEAMRSLCSATFSASAWCATSLSSTRQVNALTVLEQLAAPSSAARNSARSSARPPSTRSERVSSCRGHRRSASVVSAALTCEGLDAIPAAKLATRSSTLATREASRSTLPLQRSAKSAAATAVEELAPPWPANGVVPKAEAPNTGTRASSDATRPDNCSAISAQASLAPLAAPPPPGFREAAVNKSSIKVCWRWCLSTRASNCLDNAR